jgi:hypothetical protein
LKLSHDSLFHLSQRAVGSHWMHLKPEISLEKLSSPRDEANLKALAGIGTCDFGIGRQNRRPFVSLGNCSISLGLSR